MATRGYAKVSQAEYDSLLKRAIRVEGHGRAHTPEKGDRMYKTVARTVEVPVVEEVKVDVTKHVPVASTQKKLVKGQELVPVQKYKDVEESIIEIKEEKVNGYRTVWKQVREPCVEIVKKPVVVKKAKRVPYTDYELREVSVEVDVPCDQVNRVQGYRVDKQVRGKTIEVEQDEIYEWRPHLVGKGDIRMRETGHGRDYGRNTAGKEIFNMSEEYVSGNHEGLFQTRPFSSGGRSVRSCGIGEMGSSGMYEDDYMYEGGKGFADPPPSAPPVSAPSSGAGARPGTPGSRPGTPGMRPPSSYSRAMSRPGTPGYGGRPTTPYPWEQGGNKPTWDAGGVNAAPRVRTQAWGPQADQRPPSLQDLHRQGQGPRPPTPLQGSAAQSMRRQPGYRCN